MLVLSRRLKEKVLFPSINAAVQVLSVKGGKVRLGIEAPSTVTVIREELQNEPGRSGERIRRENDAGLTQIGQLSQMLRNRLDVASIGLALLARQLNDGLLQEVHATLHKIQEEFDVLRERLESSEGEPSARARKSPRALLAEGDRNVPDLLAGFPRVSGLEIDMASDGASTLNHLHNVAP